MTNDNKTPGYYTPIDGRLVGPIAIIKPEHIVYLRMSWYTRSEAPNEWDQIAKYSDHIKSLPSYAVSPDLLLKERMVENLDFKLVADDFAYTNELFEKKYRTETIAVPIKPASLDNAGTPDSFVDRHLSMIKLLQAQVGSKKLYVECLPQDKGAFNILNTNQWLQEIKIPDFKTARSFTSKDMEALLDFVSGYEFKISEGVTNRLTLCDGDWYWENDTDGDQPLSANEVVNIFLNRDDK